MKRLKDYFLMLLMMLGVVATATSCKDDDPIQENNNTPAEEQKDVTYTVMMYGCGGGNLDEALLYNLGGVEAATYSKKVNFTALVKFSTPYQTQYPGTRLINKTENGMTNEQVHGQYFRLDNPQNLADFIKDAKTRMPADKYILILWDHGISFTIQDQPVADSYPETSTGRGLAFDDNIGDKGMSIFEMQKGLELAGCTGENKLDLLYWDVCLMNTIENLYQVRNNTKYVLAAAHYTSGLGGQYTALMESLNDNNTIEDAMKEYMPATFNNWTEVEGKDGGKDLVLSDLSYVESVVQAVKEYTTNLVELKKEFDNEPNANSLRFDLMNSACGPNDFGYYYTLDGSENLSEEEQAQLTGALYYFGNSDAVDMLSIFTRVGGSLLDARLSASAYKLKKAIQNMCPIRYSVGTPDFIETNKVSVGICWSRNNDFKAVESSYPEASNTLEEVYKMLDFDKATGWSNYLNINDFKYLGINEDGRLYDATSFVYTWTINLIGSADGGQEETKLFDDDMQFTLTQAYKFAKFLENPKNDGKYIYVLQEMEERAEGYGWDQFKVQIKFDGQVNENDPSKDKYDTEYLVTPDSNGGSAEGE